MGLLNSYLVLYNSIQAIGWFRALFLLLGNFIESKSISSAYAVSGNIICICQLVSLLEVVHASLGIVKSGVLTSFMQWAGRSHVLFCILYKLTEIQNHPSVFIMFVAWSLSEVIRYPQYALSLIKLCPYWLLWLRYTAFIVLYPLGLFTGEMWLMISSLPFIKQKNIYGNFFNTFFMNYHLFLLVLLTVYPFLWMQLYLHMFKQRKSKLSLTKSTKSKKVR